MKLVQAAKVISDGGRDGLIESSESGLRVDFRDSGTGEAITPEHLFGGAYAACYHSALKSAAERAHLDLTGSTVIATVRLEEDDRGSYQLAVELRAALPGLNADKARHLMHLAHDSCPYSRAVRGNVTVTLALD